SALRTAKTTAQENSHASYRGERRSATQHDRERLRASAAASNEETGRSAGRRLERPVGGNPADRTRDANGKRQEADSSHRRQEGRPGSSRRTNATCLDTTDLR